LRRIGQRVARQMPESKLDYRFFLIDDPDANAFALPGGRVYVTRKLITISRSEDELAGVLAHELGHQLNRDSAVVMTKAFKAFLSVNSVEDREDIENKYHELLDSYRKRYARIDPEMDESQLGADQVAIFSVAKAGYDPQGVVNFWDRMTERGGRKGSWFSDFFGSTAPETKRLREFANSVGRLPSNCTERAEKSSQTEYDKWKQSVLHYDGFGKKENIQQLLTKKDLEPSLQGEINHLRFSPDGRYLLAQDDSSIFVLQREPLKFLFRIDARDALPARFTPDSQYLVFHSEALRIHKWNVSERQETAVRDVYVFRGCMKSMLSPDGSVLACLKPDADNFVPVGIRLIDVESGETLFEKKNFIDASFGDGRAFFLYRYLIEKDAKHFGMDFSADGRYFLAGLVFHQLGYDLHQKKELVLPPSLKRVMKNSFSFMGADRLIGVDGDRGQDAKILRLPSGEVERSGLHIGPLWVQAATAGEFAIIRPLIETPAGIMDLKENKIFLASKTDALDVYDGTWALERTNGEIALYRRPDTTPRATVQLPRAPLGSLRASLFSQDLRFLAVSDRTRGQLWDLTAETTVQLGPFNGAHLAGDQLLIDFAPPDRFRKLRTEDVSEKELRREENEKQGDTIARIDLSKKAMIETSKYKKRQKVVQMGSVYLVSHSKDDEHPSRDVMLEAHDFSSGQLLWTRFFKRLPGLGWSPVEEVLVLTWDISDRAAKDEIKQDPEAARLVESISQRDASYLVAAIDARSGKTVARFPIDTGKGSFRLTDSFPSTQYLTFTDNNHRVLVYNMQGKRVGRFFGRKPAVSTTSGMLAIEREPGRLSIYDLASLTKRDELTFNASVEYAQFSADGKRLAILTEQQQVYVVDVSRQVLSKN
jgi:hypothetical protein